MQGASQQLWKTRFPKSLPEDFGWNERHVKIILRLFGLPLCSLRMSVRAYQREESEFLWQRHYKRFDWGGPREARANTEEAFDHHESWPKYFAAAFEGHWEAQSIVQGCLSPIRARPGPPRCRLFQSYWHCKANAIADLVLQFLQDAGSGLKASDITWYRSRENSTMPHSCSVIQQCRPNCVHH